jgi:hypothetical protein
MAKRKNDFDEFMKSSGYGGLLRGIVLSFSHSGKDSTKPGQLHYLVGL